MADKKEKGNQRSGIVTKNNTSKPFSTPKKIPKNILLFEELISGFSAILNNTPENNLEIVLNSWIEKFVIFLMVDRCIVTEYMPDLKTMHILLNYTLPEIETVPVIYDYHPIEGVIEELKKGAIIKVEKIPDDLPQILRGGQIEKDNTKSLVLVPLSIGDEVIGSLTFSCYRKERKWSNNLVRRIKLIGEIIANTIQRIRSHKSFLKVSEHGRLLEETYSSVIKNANLGFMIIRLKDHIIIDVNDEYCRMSGYTSEELIGKKTWEIDASMDKDKVENEKQTALQEGSIHITTSHKRKDGSIFDVEVSSNLFGANDVVYSFVRDITALNQTHKELEERLEFEELMAEFSAALITPDDYHKELNNWLKKFVHFLRVDRGVVIEHKVDSRTVNVLIQYSVPEVDMAPLNPTYTIPVEEIEEFKKGLFLRAEKIPEDLPEMLRGGLIEQEKTRSVIIVPLLAGGIAIGSLTFATYREEHRWSDDLVRRIKLIGEITANAIIKKHSIDALLIEIEQRERIEAKYSSVVKNANVGFSISDIDQNIIDVNDEYCRMSGYSRDELLAMKISDIDITFNLLDDGVLNEILTKGAIHHEVIHKKKDGTLIDIAVSSTLNKKENTLYSFMRDITEEKKAKIEKEERLAFEELVSEFSASLMNIELNSLNEELKKWIIRFVDFLGIGRGVISEYDYDNCIMNALINYTASDSIVETASHDNVLKTSEMVMKEFKKGAMIRAEKIPEELPLPFRGWIIEKHNTKSLVVVPLISEGQIIGNLTFASYIKERKWPDDIFNRIKLIGEIIANAILRMRASEALNKAQADLRERLKFEEVISEFSTALINIKPDDILSELEKWFVKFIDLMDADKCSVNEYSDDQQIIKNLIQYSVPEVNVTIPAVRKTPEGEIDELKKGIIKVEKIPEDLPQMFYGSFIEMSKAKSLIIVPLLTGNRIFGNLAITNYRKERKWSDELIRRIKLVGEIVGNAILRMRTHETLVMEMERRHLLEERYSSIIKTANVGFMISDLNANIWEVNDAYCEMSGYTRDELLSMKIFDLDISGDSEKVDNDKRGIFLTGAFHHETSHIRKDGSTIIVLISANLLEKEGIICSFIRDVTELKIAREDLEDQLKFEKLTSEFSAALINLKLDTIDKELDPWVKKYVEFLEVERGIINEYDYDKGHVNVIATYTDPFFDVPPTDKSNEAPPSILEKLAKGDVIRAEKIPEDLPDIFNDSIIRKHGTKSILIVPLSAENQIIGNLTFATYTKVHEWSDEFVRRIKLIGEIIANALLRKRSNDALISEMLRRQQLEERYTSIIKNANVGFMITDLNQNILVVNDEYSRLSGFSHDELMGMKISDIDFTEDFEKVEDDGFITVERGSLFHQARHKHKSGRIYDVEVNSNFLEGEKIIFSFIRDVTELTQAKRELVERLTFEELVSEFSAALINVKINDIKSKLDNWLKRFAELLDVDRWAIGQYEDNYGIYRFICTYNNPDLDPRPPDYPMVMINDGRYGLEKYLIKGEYIKLDSSNDRLPDDLSVWEQQILDDGTKSILMLPLMAGETLLGSMVIATLDHEKRWTSEIIRRLKLVAEIFANALIREKNDSELDNYRIHLEKMVEERTARLEKAQKDLVLSEKMATLGRLTATVSHELRNPLGTIRTSVFSIGKRMKGQDDKMMAALDRAERNIKRCDLIIDELLNYSRVQDLKYKATALDIWIREVVDETKPPYGISVKTELNAGIITIDLDQERFRRCMVNILINAYQAIEEKASEVPGNVIVSTHKEQDKIILEISDNGVGFDMAIKSKLFEPLFSTKAFGVGLGIPITRQIIEQHGFQMDMRGEPLKGASVIITIPIINKENKKN